MYVFPLIKRELYVAVRKPTTLWWRLGAGGGAMGGAFWAMMVWGASASFSGTFLFRVICVVGIVAVVFAGAACAVDAISLERRDGTLPLLFLTELDAWGVLLGKVAATGAVPFLTLLSMFPSLAICQLIGGLTAGELWSCFLALVIALLFTLCATLLVSTVARERRTVVLGTTVLLLVTNPLLLLYAAMRPGTGRYMLVGTAYLCVAGLFLFVAGVILDRTWRVTNKTQDSNLAIGNAPPLSRASLESSPVAWMMLRRGQTRTRVRAIGFCCGGIVAAWLAAQIARGSNPTTVLCMLLACHMAVLFGILSRTAYAFFNEQRDGSFELFICTPLVNEDIFRGFARFLLARYRPVLIALTVYDCVLCAMLASGRWPRLSSFPIAMALIVWITFGAIRWLGVYRALMMNKPLFSAFATFTRVALFPLILSIFFLFAPRTNYLKVCVFWVGATGFLAAFFAADARRVLIERGRELLLRPASEKPPHIESEWSFINWENPETEPTALAIDGPVGV
jgi:hypothetical protein